MLAFLAMKKRFCIYILARKPWGTLYTGVTSNLEKRIYQHREGLIEGFTKKYGVKTLVYFEEHGEADRAIRHEKRIKKWPRAWKIDLIRTDNPDWRDLAVNWYPVKPTSTEIGNWVAQTGLATARTRL
jgi:putative endonuclease